MIEKDEIYNFLSRNYNLLEIRTNKEHPILFKNLTNYIYLLYYTQGYYDKGSDEYNLIENYIKYSRTVLRFLKYVEYISYSDIISIIDKNIDEIIHNYDSYKKVLYIPKTVDGLIDENKTKKKSNYFFTFYFLKKYIEKTGKKDFYFFTENLDDLNNYTNDNILAIICDDFAYSGKQLESNFSGKKYNNNIKFFLNIIGNTIPAYERLAKYNNIIFPLGRKESNMTLKKALTNTFFRSRSERNKADILYNKDDRDKLLKQIFKNSVFKYNKVDEVVDLVETEYSNGAHNRSMIYRIISKSRIAELNYSGDSLDEDIMTDAEDYLNMSMVYIAFKYPDYISIAGNLCCIEALLPDTNYITSPKLYKNIRDSYPDSYIETMYFDNYSVPIEECVKIGNYLTYEDNITFNSSDIMINDEKVFFHPKYQSYLLLIDFDNKDGSVFCNEYSIVPFYKSINWL